MLRDIDPPQPAPPRRVATPLPAYRYVPGLNPHPFRHTGGHLYTDGSAPVEPPWDATQPWERDPAWLYALDLLDQRYWWEAHEALEALWHQAPDGLLREGIQGLIQAGASWLKSHMGHHRAASTLGGRARQRLGRVRDEVGASWRGVDLDRVLAQLP